MSARALRVLFVANDGFSAGHVARTIAIARALGEAAARRAVEVRALIATTSEAHALLAHAHAAIVRLPPPLAARHAGFSDAERRRVVRGAIEGAALAFDPDLLVADTFPQGPHGELAGSAIGRRRALVRRSVTGAAAIGDGIERYDLAILAGDPSPLPDLPIATAHVPPIVIGGDRFSRARARDLLGLPSMGRVLLVTAGGGGDADGAARAEEIARAAARIDPGATVAIARGPLSPRPPTSLRAIDVAPLEPYLAAFDGAISAAGYNTAHALAAADVPAALFALPRPFDDQAARAARLAAAGHAVVLDAFDDATVRAALDAIAVMKPTPLEATGAARAADALLDLATQASG